MFPDRKRSGELVWILASRKSPRVRWKEFLARVTLPVPQGTLERWQSGRMRRSRKPVCPKGYREFESLLLRLEFDLLMFADCRGNRADG